MEQHKIRKAVIAAAGFGTRFLPQTKAMPKEMLPLVDKPIIQYIVEELVGAGIEDIIIVTGYHKRSVEDHFDALNADLRENLRSGGKTELLEMAERIPQLANFIYVRQKGPYGTGTPLLNVEHLIGDEPFIYCFADDFVLAEPSRFQQLINVHQNRGGSVLTCIKAQSPDDYTRYGFAGGTEIAPGVLDVATIIEKPGSREQAPSDFASVSGYLLEPSIFGYLRTQRDNLQPGRELMVQESMQSMIDAGQHFYACEIQNGKYYDTGNKLEYIKAVIDFSLMHEDIGPAIREHLQKLNLHV
jgi:UTP--glucose-1-phosphate uridylyltransferase